MTIHVNNVIKKYGEEVLFDGIQLKISDKERIGIVGENGSGKSTLLKILAGIENIQAGEIIVSKNTKIAYLDQSVEGMKGTVRSYLMESYRQILDLEMRNRELEKKMAIELDEERLELLLEQYGKSCSQFEMLGGYDISYQLERVAEGLNLVHLLERDISALSGGERVRVKLAKLLLQKADVLLLDEPTNHLDFSGIRWLEDYLHDLDKTVIIVSHDRMFLNHTVSKIFEIELGEIIVYHGNYDAYKKEKILRLEQLQKDYDLQQKMILKLQNAIRRYRQWAVEGDNESFYKKAKQLERKLDEIDRLRKPQSAYRRIDVHLKQTQRSSREVITCENMVKQFGDKVILDHADFYLMWQDRVVICGDNGCGKSTFIKLLLQEEELEEGEIRFGNHVQIGYLPQMICFPQEKKRLIEYFCYEAMMNEEEARAYLHHFGFVHGDMLKRLSFLSGGERVRLKLALILKQEVNFIIFDEPTNHLDYTSIEIVEQVLREFKGTLLVVSHDRYFIERINAVEFILEKGCFRLK